MSSKPTWGPGVCPLSLMKDEYNFSPEKSSWRGDPVGRDASGQSRRLHLNPNAPISEPRMAVGAETVAGFQDPLRNVTVEHLSRYTFPSTLHCPCCGPDTGFHRRPDAARLLLPDHAAWRDGGPYRRLRHPAVRAWVTTAANLGAAECGAPRRSTWCGNGVTGFVNELVQQFLAEQNDSGRETTVYKKGGLWCY
jgi:hypothetical protein